VGLSSVSGSSAPHREPPPLPSFAASFFGRLKQVLLFWRPAADVVQMSVFGPPRVAPGANIHLQIFTHEAGAFASVCTLSRAFHQDGELLATDYIQRAVYRGAEIGLHLSVANAKIGRSLLEVRWLGQPQPRSFEVHVPWESPAGPAAGVLSAGLDGVLAGRVEFGIQILPRRA
jgi:hypothetical protein